LSKYPNHWWKDFHQGKMDYLYFFIILGLSKLKESGKLGFITTSFWPAADGAGRLRKYILENALIKEIIDFGEVKIFEGARGQRNMVFILEKCPDRRKAEKTIVEMEIKENIEKKKKHRIKIIKVKKDFEGKTHKDKIENMVEWIEKYINRDKYEDEFIDVFYSGVKQGELTERVWNLYPERIRSILEKIQKIGDTAINVFDIPNGISTNADRVSDKNIKYIPSWKIQKFNIKTGDPIFLLKGTDLSDLRLDMKEKELVKPYYQNVDLGSYVPERISDSYIIYTDDSVQINNYPMIIRHLEKYREILENRAGRTYVWYRLHRPREKEIFERVKIISPHYRHTRPFVYSDSELYTSEENYIMIKHQKIQEDEKYFIALLNSLVVDMWIVNACGKKASGYELLASNLTNIPIRRINFDDEKEVEVHSSLVKKVDGIIKLKKELAEYNKFYSGVRLTRIENLEDVPEPDEYLLTKNLGDEDKRNIRTHPKVTYEPKNPDDFHLSAVGSIEPAPLFAKKLDESLLSILLKGKNKKSMRIIAPKEIIEYLCRILSGYKGKSWNEIKEIPIAKDLHTFISKRKEVSSRVKSLLTEIQKIQTEIDEIVYNLYGITEKERRIIERTLSE
ncbi:MAG: TaqI-like C-terminal specificity domain-containing protein, partial [bacterium]|nr:TaqI-like C-terminal specificity domain-containing protein [bacterium]